MLFRVLPLFLVIIVGCKDNNSPPVLAANFFEDIDIRTLKGIGETKSDQYPNIEVLDSSTFRVLTYHIDSKRYVRRLYERKNDYWETSFFTHGDTADIHTVRLIYPDKYLEYSYSDLSAKKIFDVGVLKGNRMEYYNPRKAVYLEPSPANLDSIIALSSHKVSFTFDTTNSIMKMTREFKDNDIVGSDTWCYPKIRKSIFWWLEARDYIDTLTCQ